MNVNPWFKFYAGDYLNEVKLKGAGSGKKSCFVVALCHAADNCGRLDTKFVTSDIIKMDAGVRIGGEEWDELGNVYEWLVEREFGVMEGQYFVFKNWSSRQTMTAYDRVKKHREKMKNDNADNNDDNKLITAEQIRTDKNRTDLFDRFWSRYPKKIGKQEALTAFLKVKPDEELTDRIISSVEAHQKTAQWQDNEGRYIPHAATYLNKRRWEDDISPKKEGPKIIEWEKTENGMKPVYEPSEFAKYLNKRI